MARTVTFDHPFRLPGMEMPHAAGTFELHEESEALDVSFPAYRTALTVKIPNAGGYEAWPISAAELDRILAEDKRYTL